MDIATQVEIVLRDAGYDTWPLADASPPVTCFENPGLIGFVHVFKSADALLSQWEVSQESVLKRHTLPLRVAGAKAWNVYSIFLTEEQAPSHQREIEGLEENFALTRKIANAAIRTPEDVERVLLPLTAVKAQPLLGASDFRARLQLRLKEIPPEAVTAFLGAASPDELARILGAVS